MLDYFLVDYKKYLVERRIAERKDKLMTLRTMPLLLKLLGTVWIVSGLAFIYFLFSWILSNPDEYKAPYALLSFLFFISVTYSWFKSVDYMYDDRFYENMEKYKSFGLDAVRNLLRTHEVYTKSRLEVMIAQIDEKVPESVTTVNFVKKVIEIGIVPLLIGLSLYFFDEYNWTAVLIYSLAFIVIIVAFVLILSPSWKVLEEEDTKMLKNLKKELQNILIVDFGDK